MGPANGPKFPGVLPPYTVGVEMTVRMQVLLVGTTNINKNENEKPINK